MPFISDVAGQELVWVQPARLKQFFELHAGDNVVATLRFERASLAVGETDDQQWTFKREGFWRPRITVPVHGSEGNVALFTTGWAGGTLDLSQGRTVHFGATNFWRSQWAWEQVKGTPLVRFKSHGGLLKTGGQVEIEGDPARSPELPLLVVLGWYLLILSGRDAAASAVATAVIVGATG